MEDLSNKSKLLWPEANLRDWGCLRAELLFIYDQAIPAGSANQKGRREGDISAWLVRSGSARMVADGQEVEASAGQWLVCFGTEIDQTIAPDTHLLSLRVLQDWPDGTHLFKERSSYVLNAASHPKLEKLALPLLKIAEHVSWDAGGLDPREVFLWRSRVNYRRYVNYQGRLMAWLAELASALIREGEKMHLPGTEDPRLARVLQIVEASALGDSFPEKAVCRVGGLSIGRLNILCVRAYGFTLHSYWEKRRIQQAKRALEISDIRIKEVASELGFAQLSHFSVWFKRHAGASPRAYRQGHQLGK